ncbi:MAG TPA: DoxX family protein [Acidobacteriota bacterium]|nr:DoxX family protein [Acidobacteriota bacterium]
MSDSSCANCECCNGWREWLHLAFRIIVGGLFFTHGITKFMGGMPAIWPMGVAGVIEILVGIAVIIGLYTHWAAKVGAVEMIIAYVYHVFGFFMAPVLTANWNPIGQAGNGGEAALLFLAAFLTLAAYGAGSMSVDSKMCGECEVEEEVEEAPKAPASKKKKK